ncbi:disease resistance protein RPM1 [Aegilops tauschii subsp. strangulata]|uniref:Disease resistance protein RPM1 n=2 Tax=Aegilops tauschii subsp. strangulata TaxID=200361 RepID=A0A453A8N7_AEGTS|nr:disease resistance protein RPM1 [Aegilops tauschii subsp. strangulata]XP_020162710.1 disease resistance protein RPM1 [Aegilops tauschii subsp. strangulata]XP_020162711.1 disease resistance protein RPM1 [Aegilops tauschii subsp. strangulata]
MAEIVLLLVIEKIGVALANGAAHQAGTQFSRYATRLIELQGSMGRVVRELRIIHDVLCQMDIRNRHNQVYEGWLDEVRKVAHGMEDMVDEYMYQVGREHDTGCCFYLKKGLRKPRSLLSLNQISSKVKEIEKDLAHLSEMKNRWVPMINNEDTSSLNYMIKKSQDLAIISRSLDNEDLVGVDENRGKLEQWLGSDDVECSLITLTGMGGLGKTALASNVYRKEREKFQCHAWVSISQTYSREDVLRNIIKELFKDTASGPSNIAAMDITSLQETLKRYLGEMKYLIILDDVWTPDAFEDLSRSLVCNGKGSRLIITTRQGDVAALASQGHVLTLEPLPEDKAWDLFCKKSFPKETNHHCPEELRLLSEEILSKCKGLPLAIVSIGSLLHVREKTVEEWKRINDQLSWEILNNSRLDHIRNVLHLSYIYLPTHLKSCFLYCSLFPEDYLFHRKKLLRLWMAEGFMVEMGASTLEEVAESYVKELVNRNMLQLVGRNSSGRMNRFRMHDIIRELAVDLCQKDRFGVIYEEDKCGGSLQRDGRRLVVHKLKKDIQQPFSSIHVLRTFITLEKSMSSFPLLPLLSEKSRYMTVLELSGLPIEKIPDAIGDLFNLRYLGLRYSRVKLLPKSIEKLSNLLTLDLCGSDIHELPAGIGKLNKLRHLFAEKNIISGRIQNIRYARGVCFPIGLGNLTNLQTLQALEVQEVDGSIRQLRELRQLRSLRIWVVKGIFCEHLCESLVQMQFLSNLDVSASDENEVLALNALPPSLQKLSLGGRLPEGALLAESPLFQAMEQNLCSLHLSWSQLREDPLPSLSQLPNLMDLCLDKAYNGEKLEFLTGWFPKLKSLYLWDMPDLKMLEIHQGAMTALETLVLGNLESMVEVPPGLEFLMPLQLLSFREITRDFLTLLRESPELVGMQWQHTLRDDDQ